MTQKRSRNGKSFLRQRKNNRGNRLNSRRLAKSKKITQQSSNIPQINPLDRSLEFWGQYSSWSSFARGLFWGSLVSAISVVSALGGVALTQIDVVEQQIVQRLTGTALKPATKENLTITTPLQVLLVEVEPDINALTGFSPATIGKSKTILLLKIEPELKLAQAINIPLDTEIEIPGFGQREIKDAYQLGGIDLLSQALNQLDTDISINRYLRTTPETFQQLMDSGNVNLTSCDPRIYDCQDKSEQILRQETAFQTIRQRLNIPGYLANFETTIVAIESQLDTDIPLPEIISLANFVKELKPDRLRVDLLPGYIANPQSNDHEPLASTTNPSSLSSTIEITSGLTNKNPWQDEPIAVQNTTENPALGEQVATYLRQRNFRDVYLMKHIPLKLEKTKIMSNYGQVETANYLKNILGLGELEAKSSLQQPDLVLQLGEDALDLEQNHRFNN